MLIEAAAAEPSLRVVVVGDGPDRDRLEQLAQPSAVSTAGSASRVGSGQR